MWSISKAKKFISCNSVSLYTVFTIKKNYIETIVDNTRSTRIAKETIWKIKKTSEARNIANQIVEKYFIRYEKNRDQKFQNVKEYLSKILISLPTG